ncbi:MAG: YqgE/AlgH family protein [Chloroflexi bacterium]|nr:YqgE/AlgH family protein [Chloroflexota bacterium]
MTTTLAGKLLVASPALLDPNFHRTVVLLCAHDEQGAFGVVLNRPLPARVGDHLPGWTRAVAWPDQVFGGGPVEPTVAIAVGLSEEPCEEPWWTPVAGGLGLVALGEDPAAVLPTVSRLRVFSGYAGWGGGQLESELLGESWFVVDARPEDAFTDNPERLWHNVLRRQPGSLAMFAFVPPDQSRN